MFCILLNRLLQVDSGEMRMQHKLTDLHFTCRDSQRQNVALAAQMFSHRTASALRFHFPEDEEKAATIDLINSAFDCLNSRFKDGQKQWDFAIGWSKYGKTLADQRNILVKAKELIGGMRVQVTNKAGVKGPKKSMLPFQKGFVISIDSTLELFERYTSKYNAHYLLTSRLNQDCLENFFSRVRGMGGSNTHPGTVEFKNRLRYVTWIFVELLISK